MSLPYKKITLKKSVTLVELIIAIVLLSMVILGVSSIDRFSRYHLRTSQRRAQLQNEVSYIMEHMSKNIGMAIGDINNPVFYYYASYDCEPDMYGERLIKVRVDSNLNGRTDPYPTDTYIGYAWSNMDGDPNRFQFCYNSDTSAHPYAYDPLGNRIAEFIPSWTGNCVDVQLTACWDPASINLATYPNGTPDNPCVTMHANISMPSVSTN